MSAEGYIPVDVRPTTPESHPEAWAEYEQQRASLSTIQNGKPGRCAGCGRFLARTIFRNKGFPPTVMWGRVDFDPGFTEITYRCTNPDEEYDEP
jgi:hypothetical protein